MSMGLRIGAGLLVLAGAVGVGSCRQILDIEEREATKAPLVAGVCGDFKYESTTCAACMDGACCETLETCSESQGCSDFNRCRFECAKTDDECMSRCRWAVTRNRRLTLDVNACASGCATACDDKCGGWNSWGLPSCHKCARESCCSSMRTCKEDARCLAYLSCTRDCSLVQGCADRCGEKHPEGAKLEQQATSCIRSNCASFCSQNDWRCLDDATTSNLAGAGRPITVDKRLFNFTSGAPWEGVTVQACNSTDFDCAAPVTSVVTDASGDAVLILPQSDRGFDGYLQIEGNGIAPGMVRYEPPFFEDSGIVGTAWPSSSDFTGMALLSGITLMPERGHSIIQVYDCVGQFAAGVSLKFEAEDGQSRAYYFNDLLPDVSATMTDGESAIGGMLNLPPGLTNVTLTVAETQQEFLSVPLLIRAGMISYLNARAQ